jgi:Spy/CpxP family protein refolding chaperone
VEKKFEEKSKFRHGWRRSPLRHKLHLDENQLDAIETMREKMHLRIIPMRQELSVKRRELMGLLKESKPDKARLDVLFKEIAHLQAEIELCTFENTYQTKELLNPDQQRQFLELFQRRLSGRGMPGFPPEPEYQRGLKHKKRERR